jgi:hypothetical protein
LDAEDALELPEPLEELGNVSFTCRLAPSALLVFPDVEAVNPGLKGSSAQLVTWNGLEGVAVAPWDPEILAVIC